jgi:hypothetical protein
VIVGAGPAGLFAAKEIVENSKMDVLLIDQGKDVEERECPLSSTYRICDHCSPCNIMSGVGGAGFFSGGMLNLRPDIGGNLFDLVRDDKEAWELIDRVDRVFLQYGAPDKLYEATSSKVEELERKAAAAGVKFISIPQRFIGTDNSPVVIGNFDRDLRSKGVEFMTNIKVVRVTRSFLTLESGEKIKFKYVILAPGRSGANWLAEEAKRLGIPMEYEPVDIGVRVEVPAVIMEPVIEVERDPKFHIITETYDDSIRTFCVNHRGFVVQEVYDEFVGVNGHSLASMSSQNTNFAFLVRIKLTEPLENTTLYGRTIALQTTTLGGGKPILQRLGDLMSGRRSTWDRIRKGNVSPTLKNVTPGDIAMSMPHRIVTDIIEGLKRLNQVIPGVASTSTLLYAPEVKFSANRIKTNQNLETPVKNMFVAGDGAGLSRGIVIAAATGILAARGVLKKERA